MNDIYIIAEAGVNHNGSSELAHELIIKKKGFRVKISETLVYYLFGGGSGRT